MLVDRDIANPGAVALLLVCAVLKCREFLGHDAVGESARWESIIALQDDGRAQSLDRRLIKCDRRRLLLEVSVAVVRLGEHATIITILLLARLPYDRLALVAGFVAHILWGYGLYFAVHRYIRHRIAIVPFGDVDRLKSIDNVEWRVMQVPELADAAGCDGLVADFAAPDMRKDRAILRELAK